MSLSHFCAVRDLYVTITRQPKNNFREVFPTPIGDDLTIGCVMMRPGIGDLSQDSCFGQSSAIGHRDVLTH
jgi:hypothetical protein